MRTVQRSVMVLVGLGVAAAAPMAHAQGAKRDGIEALLAQDGAGRILRAQSGPSKGAPSGSRAGSRAQDPRADDPTYQQAQRLMRCQQQAPGNVASHQRRPGRPLDGRTTAAATACYPVHARVSLETVIENTSQIRENPMLRKRAGTFGIVL